MPRLTDLDAAFVVATANGMSPVPTRDGAQGIRFDCPLGHGHWIVVWFKNPQGVDPAPATEEPVTRWTATGSSLQDLSLTPSLNLDNDCGSSCPPNLCPEHGCRWHGWVTNGDAA